MNTVSHDGMVSPNRCTIFSARFSVADSVIKYCENVDSI